MTREDRGKLTPHQRREVYEGVSTLLDQFDAAGREPDRWEEYYLAYAIHYLESGMVLAIGELQEARSPIANRSTKILKDLNAKPQLWSKAQLRDRLLELKAD